MIIEIKNIVDPKPSLEMIKREEKMWQVELPITFRDFLMNNNGGLPIKKIFCLS